MANHGGARKGAGRKPKADEEKSKRLAINAIVNKFGDEEKAFEFMATKAKDPKERKSFEYFKLLTEYAFGKPKETKDLTHSFDVESIPLIEWSK